MGLSRPNGLQERIKGFARLRQRRLPSRGRNRAEGL